MIPPLIALAEKTGCDLLVYHLGFEIYGAGGERIDCGVTLHRMRGDQKPSKSVDWVLAGTFLVPGSWVPGGASSPWPRGSGVTMLSF